MNSDILSYLYRIISKKDYTEYEIREKIKHKFNAPLEQIDEIIEKLQADGLVDDEAYKKRYVENKILAGYGPLYIIYALNRKGIKIEEEYIYSIMEGMDIDLKDIIKKILIKKDLSNINKCFSFLQRRGFKTDEIKELLMEVNKYGSSIL
jgi:SOS response regulatory protein OraA/RecX